MSVSVASKVSAVRVHHDAAEVREAIGLDRLRLMVQFSRQHSIVCDCQRQSTDRIRADECEGLRAFDARGNQVATFRGRQYRAIENLDRTISVYSTLIRN